MIPIFLDEQDRQELDIIYESMFILNNLVENLNNRCEDLEVIVLNQIGQINNLTIENEKLNKRCKKVRKFCKYIGQIADLAVKILEEKQRNTTLLNDEVNKLIKDLKDLKL